MSRLNRILLATVLLLCSIYTHTVKEHVSFICEKFL